MRELEVELAADPSLGQFSQAQRTLIVKQWVRSGDLDSAEVYLQAYGERLEDRWLLWSYLRLEQAEFEEAVRLMRKAVPVAELSVGAEGASVQLAHLKRAFALSSRDVVKGTALLRLYLEEAMYVEALEVVDALLENVESPPEYLYYWRAELLYRLEDYIESWYAFETYLERLGS